MKEAIGGLAMLVGFYAACALAYQAIVWIAR